jgi:lipopolysaccharide transport system ATP-binding protein
LIGDVRLTIADWRYQIENRTSQIKEISNLKYQISNLKSKILNLKSRKSQIVNRKSKIIVSKPIIKIENLSKQYRLGTIGTGTIAHDMNRWWQTKIMRRDDPYLKLGETNDRAHKGLSEYVWALKDINFEVQQGDVVGIIGRNGAGKSTLLKILSRVTAPTTGSIKVGGRLASLLEVGTGFHPELTGRENIFLNGAILGMTKAEIRSKLDEIIDFSGCERYIDTPVKRYSSGMNVRLGFAVAAFLEPEILVVDEVLAVGDAEFQKKAIGKMQDVSTNQGRTVLFVSHNMASIQNLCRNAVLMENGTITSIGNTAEIIDLYLQKNNSRFETSLCQRLDRSGNQKVLIEDFWIENSKGDKIETIISGSDINFWFKLRNNGANGKIDFGIAVSDKNDYCLTVIYSSYQGLIFDINENDKDLLINYTMFNFPYSTGIYRITARVLLDDCEADYPKYGIANVDVEKGDYYKKGDFGSKGLGPVLINGCWKMDNSCG